MTTEFPDTADLLQDVFFPGIKLTLAIVWQPSIIKGGRACIRFDRPLLGKDGVHQAKSAKIFPKFYQDSVQVLITTFLGLGRTENSRAGVKPSSIIPDLQRIN